MAVDKIESPKIPDITFKFRAEKLIPPEGDKNIIGVRTTSENKKTPKLIDSESNSLFCRENLAPSTE